MDNGGCHPLATCNDTISVTCTCPNGYRGDGRWCEMIDECLQNNGGCGQNATCLFAGPVRYASCHCNGFNVRYFRHICLICIRTCSKFL